MLVNITRDDKKYSVVVPDGAPENTWKYGIVVGPPDLSELGLPYDIEVRLHNELHNRGLIKLADASRGPQNLQGAIMAALRVDVQRLLQIYEEANSG